MSIRPSDLVRLKGGGERVTASGSVFNASNELKLKTTLKAGLIKTFE
jgi:hypothetical protein